MSEQMKVGLVLSGGGAKGAYQAGVLKALEELDTQVDMVSGASIGALNGGVLSAAPTFSEGVKRVERLWITLSEESPLQLNSTVYTDLLLSTGATLLPSGKLLLLALGFDQESILSDAPLTKLMDEFLDSKKLANGLPCYVSVYKSLGAINDISRCVLAATELKNTPDSEFLHLQSLPENEQRNALLASAALPMLFKARKVSNSTYSDGGQGGWSKVQGNTPIQPLIDAGCNLIIVTHLSDGSLWSRHDFPNTTILEIRPKSSIARTTGMLGGFKDLLGFDSEKIPSWIEQGYTDTLRCMGRVKKAVQARGELSTSQEALRQSEMKGKEVDATLNDILSRMSI